MSELIDIKTARVDEILENLEKSNLVFLPITPMSPMLFVEANVNHRKLIGKLNKSIKLTIKLLIIFLRETNANKITFSGKGLY